MQFTHVKRTTQGLSVYSELGNRQQNLTLGQFPHSKKESGTHGQQFSNYSVDVSHTWNQTIRGTKFSNFIHVVACIILHSLFIAE